MADSGDKLWTFRKMCFRREISTHISVQAGQNTLGEVYVVHQKYKHRDKHIYKHKYKYKYKYKYKHNFLTSRFSRIPNATQRFRYPCIIYLVETDRIKLNLENMIVAIMS